MAWASPDPRVGVGVVGKWLLVRVRFQENETKVTLGRLDAEDAVCFLEVVFVEGVTWVLEKLLLALLLAWVVISCTGFPPFAVRSVRGDLRSVDWCQLGGLVVVIQVGDRPRAGTFQVDIGVLAVLVEVKLFDVHAGWTDVFQLLRGWPVINELDGGPGRGLDDDPVVFNVVFNVLTKVPAHLDVNLAASPDLVRLAAFHDVALRADDELSNVRRLGWQWLIVRQVLDDTDADCDSPDEGSQFYRIDSNRDGAVGVEGERNGQERWLKRDVAPGGRAGTPAGATGGVRTLRQAAVSGSEVGCGAASGKGEKTDDDGNRGA